MVLLWVFKMWQTTEEEKQSIKEDNQIIQSLENDTPISKEEKTPKSKTVFEKKIFVLPNILFENNSDVLLPISYNSLDFNRLFRE